MIAGGRGEGEVGKFETKAPRAIAGFFLGQACPDCRGVASGLPISSSKGTGGCFCSCWGGPLRPRGMVVCRPARAGFPRRMRREVPRNGAMRISPCALVIASLALPPSLAINIGVLDDFQTGTVSERFCGTTITPVTNGQMGVLDLFITTTSAGGWRRGASLPRNNRSRAGRGRLLRGGCDGGDGGHGPGERRRCRCGW